MSSNTKKNPFLLQFQPVPKKTGPLKYPINNKGSQKLAYGSIVWAELFECVETNKTLSDIEPITTLLSPIIEQNRGVLCQNGPNSFMAMFTVNESEARHAALAISTAHHLLQLLEAVNKQRYKENKPLYQIGLSVNSGQLTPNMCSQSVPVYSNLDGDTIKTAVCLSHLNKFSPVYSAYLGEETIEMLAAPFGIRKIEKLGDLILEGRKNSEGVYVLY